MLEFPATGHREKNNRIIHIAITYLTKRVTRTLIYIEILVYSKESKCKV